MIPVNRLVHNKRNTVGQPITKSIQEVMKRRVRDITTKEDCMDKEVASTKVKVTLYMVI